MPGGRKTVTPWRRRLSSPSSGPAVAARRRLKAPAATQTVRAGRALNSPAAALRDGAPAPAATDHPIEVVEDPNALANHGDVLGGVPFQAKALGRMRGSEIGDGSPALEQHDAPELRPLGEK